VPSFVEVGDRIRYIAELKSRSDAWPEGVWLEPGIEGAVTEYHPPQPEVVVRGFEELPAYAVVKFDNGASTCIDPEDEGKRWEKIGKRYERMPTPALLSHDLWMLTINELRQKCRNLGLSDSGTKEDLVRRLTK